MKTISWFSTGVSSAVATKLLIDEIDEIIYEHIDDQHEDSMRFVKECEQWFGKKITILQSHMKTVETACLMAGGNGFLVGPHGAPCTSRLKLRVRKDWEKTQTDDLCYVWGFDCSTREKTRAIKREEAMPKQDHRFPLIEKSISKQHAHEILAASGIKRPKMYDLGYHNNNCIGCIKAAGAAYWNKIRVDFPEVFESRAKLERKIGATCMKKKVGEEIIRLYLDELDPEAGKGMEPIVADCGLFCEAMALK